MPLIESGGVEVVERDTYLYPDPGGAAKHTIAVPLSGTFDADNHTALITNQTATLSSGLGIEFYDFRYALDADGDQINGLIDGTASLEDFPVGYEIIKIPGLSSPISRQQITMNVAATSSDKTITISDPGGNWQKSRTFLAHKTGTSKAISSDDGTDNLYLRYNSTYAFERVSQTEIKFTGFSYTGASDYTFWIEIWPFG